MSDFEWKEGRIGENEILDAINVDDKLPFEESVETVAEDKKGVAFLSLLLIFGYSTIANVFLDSHASNSIITSGTMLAMSRLLPKELRFRKLLIVGGIALAVSGTVSTAMTIYSEINDHENSKYSIEELSNHSNFLEPLVMTSGFDENTMLLNSIDGNALLGNTVDDNFLQINNHSFLDYEGSDRRQIIQRIKTNDTSNFQILPFQPLIGENVGISVLDSEGGNVPVQLWVDSNNVYWMKFDSLPTDILTLKTAWNKSDVRKIALNYKYEEYFNLTDQLDENAEQKLKDAFKVRFPELSLQLENENASLVDIFNTVRNSFLYSIDYRVNVNDPRNVIDVIKYNELYCDTASKLIMMLSEVYDLPDAMRITGGIIKSDGIVYTGSLHAKNMTHEGVLDGTSIKVDETSEATLSLVNAMESIGKPGMGGRVLSESDLNTLSASMQSDKSVQDLITYLVNKLNIPAGSEVLFIGALLSTLGLMGAMHLSQKQEQHIPIQNSVKGNFIPSSKNSKQSFLENKIKINIQFISKMMNIFNELNSKVEDHLKEKINAEEELSRVVSKYVHALNAVHFSRNNLPNTSGNTFFEDPEKFLENLKDIGTMYSNANRKQRRFLRHAQKIAWKEVVKEEGGSPRKRLYRLLVDHLIQNNI